MHEVSDIIPIRYAGLGPYRFLGNGYVLEFNIACSHKGQRKLEAKEWTVLGYLAWQ
jgi:hypothetical protein